MFSSLRALVLARFARSKGARSPTADLFRHIGKRLPGFEIETAFDVGANVGQTMTILAQQAPRAAIYSFEPVAAAYQELLRLAEAKPNVQCFRLALGSSTGIVTVTSQGTKTSNRIVAGRAKSRSEQVAMTTGDAFCLEQQIGRISFLKVDTEGHDLEVLLGFRGMLEDSRIDLIQIEAGMNATNTWHVPLERLKAFLEPLGYFLSQLYEQRFEKKLPILRRANAVFISTPLANRFSR